MDNEKSDKVLAEKLPSPVVGEAGKLAMNGHEAETLLTKGMDASPPTLTLLSQNAAQVQPEDMSEQESEKGAGEMPNVAAELFGLPKTIPGPVNASNSTEPENMLERQPVVENTPDKPLSADAPEPEPEKLVKSVPEAAGLAEQTLHDPVALLQPMGVEQHSKPKEVPEQAQKIVSKVMEEELLKKEEESKMAELKKEEERKMAELKKEEERKMAELEKEEEKKMAELKKEEERKEAELKKEEERKMEELQKEQERKMEEFKKEQERKMEELMKEEERKQEELRKEQDRKEEELMKEQDRKVEELRKEQDRKEEELRKEQDRKEAELKKEQERKEAELKKEQKEAELKKEQKEAELKKEQDRKEAELKKEQERKEAELKKEQERKEAELKKEEERKEAELKKEQERKAAELKKEQEREAELKKEEEKAAELKKEQEKEAELKKEQEKEAELKKEEERKEAELKKEQEKEVVLKAEKETELKQTEEKKEAALNETEEPKEADLMETKLHVEEDEREPAPGSLSFALLEQEQTKVLLQASRTLVVLRGLPGSGKSRVARAIADNFQDLCSVFCADDHGIKPENPEASTAGYKALDEAVVAHCSAQKTAPMVVVVDDTNHTLDRLACLGEIAEQQRLVVMFLEPSTEWRRDLKMLPKKTRRDLKDAQFEAMNGPFEDTILPLYFGWFLTPTTQDKVKCTSMDFLKTLDTLEAFKKHLTDFNVEAEKEVDLEQYFQSTGILHCTTKFCDYGKAEGAKEYAEQTAVKELYGSAFELSLSALFVTPRTVGARVSLSEEQLVLWPADAEKEKEAEAQVPTAGSLPLGSRAHITLGCANGVEPVQTGFDLLEILALQQDGQQGELVEEMELGSLAYYGNGRWLLSLREPISVQAIFSSLYHPKKADPTKEKKRKKCAIL